LQERRHVDEAARFTITLANKEWQSFEVDGNAPLLNTLEAHGVLLPYGCRYGGCISYDAKLAAQWRRGLTRRRRAQRTPMAKGYMLLCVARPTSDCTLQVGIESHDKLYRNPFQSPLRLDELKADIHSRVETLEDTP